MFKKFEYENDSLHLTASQAFGGKVMIIIQDKSGKREPFVDFAENESDMIRACSRFFTESCVHTDDGDVVLPSI